MRSDVEAWDLPGFGTPRSRGFGSTKEEYVDWLIERLERVGEPVDWSAMTGAASSPRASLPCGRTSFVRGRR